MTNELIAEQIMGLDLKQRKVNYLGTPPENATGFDYVIDGGEGCECKSLPNYYGDIKEAMDVVEKLQGQGWHISLELFPDGWYAEFTRYEEPDTGKSIHSHINKSLPTAICETAIKTTG
jgi:hypothetical protein